MRRANLERKVRGVAGIIVWLWTVAFVRDRSSSEDTPMQARFGVGGTPASL